MLFNLYPAIPQISRETGRSQYCGVLKVHNTQIHNTMECPFILVHYESANNKWKGVRGFYVSVRLLSASVSHCFHLDYLDCSLSCWHWGASCIYAILSCSLQIGKALTYRKLDRFAAEAKKIMQTCTDSLYKRNTRKERTQHTLKTVSYTASLHEKSYSCVHFQKILHENKKHYPCFLCFNVFAAIPP